MKFTVISALPPYPEPPPPHDVHTRSTQAYHRYLVLRTVRRWFLGAVSPMRYMANFLCAINTLCFHIKPFDTVSFYNKPVTRCPFFFTPTSWSFIFLRLFYFSTRLKTKFYIDKLNAYFTKGWCERRRSYSPDPRAVLVQKIYCCNRFVGLSALRAPAIW